MRRAAHAHAHAHAAGFTLLEIMIAVAILASISVLTWGSFNQTFKSKKSVESQMGRYRAARIAMDRMVRAGKFPGAQSAHLLGASVHGRTLGLIGGGGLIGQAVARRARGFEMRVLYWAPQRNPAAEAAALVTVATGATQFTPAVTLAPPDAVLVEIGGSLRLFGGLPKLVAELSAVARDLGYHVRLALAPTPIAALLFARAGEKSGVRDDFSHILAISRAGRGKGPPTRDQ